MLLSYPNISNWHPQPQYNSLGWNIMSSPDFQELLACWRKLVHYYTLTEAFDHSPQQNLGQHNNKVHGAFTFFFFCFLAAVCCSSLDSASWEIYNNSIPFPTPHHIKESWATPVKPNVQCTFTDKTTDAKPPPYHTVMANELTNSSQLTLTYWTTEEH